MSKYKDIEKVVNFGWESEEEKLMHAMKIPAKRKLEWLYEMNRFSQKYSVPGAQAIRRKLREKL